MLDRILDEVEAQVAWDIKRGMVDLIDREYIGEVAESILSSEEYDIFSENDGATILYQNGQF